MAVREKEISEYTSDPLNHNKGSEYGKELLEKSIVTNGLCRSILASEDGVIIAGNKTLEKAKELGIDKVVEVEADGSTLVVVRRTDIQSGTKKFYDAAIADNTVSKHNYVEDATVMEAIAEQYDVNPYDWGAERPDDDEKEESEGENPMGTFPLSIILNAKEYKEFQLYKKENRIKTDTEAFKDLFKNKNTE